MPVKLNNLMRSTLPKNDPILIQKILDHWLSELSDIGIVPFSHGEMVNLKAASGVHIIVWKVKKRLSIKDIRAFERATVDYNNREFPDQNYNYDYYGGFIWHYIPYDIVLKSDAE